MASGGRLRATFTHGVLTTALLGTALGPGAARAQGLETHHPVVPAAGIAAENGPGTLWVNPANLGYDPDARFGLSFARGGLDAPTAFGATIGAGGMGVGIHNQLRPTALGVASDWSLDYATSFALPSRLSLGVLLSWNFIEDANNYVAWDAGVSWRPLPWLGFGSVAQNIGNPDPNGFAIPRTGAGIALRPGSLAVFGVDFVREFGTATTEDSDHLVGTARLRPIEGLYFRGGWDGTVSADGLERWTASAGIEVYLGGVGVGYVGSNDPSGTGQTAFIGTDEPGESLIRSGRRVPMLEIDRPPPYTPRTGLFAGNQKSWLDTLELLRRIEDDPGVRGLAVTLDGASLSFARARELRDRIVALGERGKPVLVYLTGAPSNTDYYVASGAARIAMHPATDLELVGLSIELTQFRGLFDLVGVTPQFVKRADYKTAPETYTDVEPSPANLEMTEALLDDLYGELVDGVATGRKVEASVVRGWIDNGPHAADEALAAGMVDVLLYPDQLDEELDKLHGGSVSTDDLVDLPQPRSPWEDPKQIAVVYVEGSIVAGESAPGGFLAARGAGSKSVVRQLDRARRDPQVRAVVLRVDSPGGSSFASDEIWRATQRLEERDKPVVVSMGSLAASGGYYVAAGADAIWAEPSTLTGSIGVFSGKFSIGELQERLGVTTTVLGRGRNSGLSSMAKPWDDLQRARMQALVDHTYEQFKSRVVDGRSLDAAKVEEIARGRVWSGKRAVELGLVDHLGGFQDAIADARERAGIRASRKVGLVTYSDSGDLLQSLAPSIATSIAGKVGAPRLSDGFGGFGDGWDRLEALLGPIDPLLVPVLHPEEDVWLLDPYTLRIQGE
ncbi:MAG: signal peptide peptidase SppA [Myxococcota bacterium]